MNGQQNKEKTMAELYDILGDNRFTASLADLAVPDTYPVEPDLTVTFASAPAGRYVATYNFEADFNGAKDKFIGYTATGNLPMAGTEFSEAIPTGNTDALKNRLYGAEFDHIATGDITVGLMFRDVTGGNGFTILTADVSIMRVGNL